MRRLDSVYCGHCTVIKWEAKQRPAGRKPLSNTLLDFAKISKRGCGKGKNERRELELFVPNPGSPLVVK